MRLLRFGLRPPLPGYVTTVVGFGSGKRPAYMMSKVNIRRARGESMIRVPLLGLFSAFAVGTLSCTRIDDLLNRAPVPESDWLVRPSATSTKAAASPEAPYTVTALSWAATEGRLWCLENRPPCRELSVYKSYDGDYEMMIDVRVRPQESIEDAQRSALNVADQALAEAFYRMEAHASWLQLVEVVVRDTPGVIMSRISLEGHPGISSTLSAMNSRIAWVTGEGGMRPASDKTPTSTPWMQPH